MARVVFLGLLMYSCGLLYVNAQDNYVQKASILAIDQNCDQKEKKAKIPSTQEDTKRILQRSNLSNVINSINTNNSNPSNHHSCKSAAEIEQIKLGIEDKLNDLILRQCCPDDVKALQLKLIKICEE